MKRSVCLVLSALLVCVATAAFAGSREPEVPQKSEARFEKVVIPDCEAIVYGWDVIGKQTLALEDTLVFLGDWQVFPRLHPPVAQPEPSEESIRQHALNVAAVGLQRELLKSGKSISESKQAVVDYYRASPLVSDIVHVADNRYHLRWNGENEHTVLIIDDEPPAPPYLQKRLMARQINAVKVFNRLIREFEKDKLIVISSCGGGFYHDRQEEVYAEISEIRNMDIDTFASSEWGPERRLPPCVAEQIAYPLNESMKSNK